MTARGAQELAELAGLPDPDAIFVDALLHNIGEVVLLRVIAKECTEEHAEALEPRRIAEELEARHESVGRTILRSWGMPERIITLAAHHHSESPVPLTTEDETRRHLVMAAWTMAVRIGFDYLPGQQGLQPDEHLRALELARDKVMFVFRDARDWLGD